eukprot:TRINITY_DN3163_c0_g1_i8.p1 TRINITY_DN3163_c0_g1~~TRINITY_DN3163_c0_g1_i8.p1  ORF type:complete len:495 (+),score=51.30 TRINITY_DN3163_c0_g1_i8:57-1541(+)
MSYVAKIFASREENHEEGLKVIGKIPTWLSGKLIRTGPAKFQVGKDQYQHWFDGLAQLHAFDIRSGAVHYSSRMLGSTAYQKSISNNVISASEFGTFRTADPCQSIFRRALSHFGPPDFSDNGNVSVIKGPKENLLIAATETAYSVIFSRKSLEVSSGVTIAANIDAQTRTAHPLVDGGGLWNLGTYFGYRSGYILHRTPQAGQKVDRSFFIESAKPSYIHSFGMSERYAVIVESPLKANPVSLLVAGLRRLPFISHFRWQKEQGSLFTVVDKADGDVKGRFNAPPFFSFHTVNTFEEGNEVVIDLSCYQDSTIIDALYLKNLRSVNPKLPPSRLLRFRLPVDGTAAVKNAEPQIIWGDSFELPTINNRYVGRPYRFAYGLGIGKSATFLDRIVKVDTSNVTAPHLMWHQKGTFPSEPVWVSNPQGKKEEDGVILSVVLDPDHDSAFLLVLDAASFEEIGRASIPHPVAFGLHGLWTMSNRRPNLLILQGIEQW